MEIVYVVHHEPVGRGSQNYIAQVDLERFNMPGQAEQLWLTPTASAEQYRLACIPLVTYGLSNLDLVSLNSEGTHVDALVQASGHRTYRMLFAPDDQQDLLIGRRDAVLQVIHELDLAHELHGPRMVAVDVPPDRDADALMRLSEQYARLGLLHDEWNDVLSFDTW